MTKFLVSIAAIQVYDSVISIVVQDIEKFSYKCNTAPYNNFRLHNAQKSYKSKKQDTTAKFQVSTHWHSLVPHKIILGPVFHTLDLIRGFVILIGF